MAMPRSNLVREELGCVKAGELVTGGLLSGPRESVSLAWTGPDGSPLGSCVLVFECIKPRWLYHVRAEAHAIEGNVRVAAEWDISSAMNKAIGILWHSHCPSCGSKRSNIYFLPGEERFGCVGCASLIGRSARGQAALTTAARKDLAAFLESRAHLTSQRSRAATLNAIEQARILGPMKTNRGPRKKRAGPKQEAISVDDGT